MHKTLMSENHIDGDTGFRLRHVRSETERFKPHDHDYFELFLVLSGTATHIANGEMIPVSASDLIFISDTDIHDYTDYKGGFEFLNLAFTRETLAAAAEFLDCNEEIDSLCSRPSPPTVHLGEKDVQALHFKLASLLTDSTDSKKKKTQARRIIADILADHLMREENFPSSPFWLRNAYLQMQKPKNFLLGAARFFELSGKTREHSARALRAYYGLTPSEYITELRLNYAAGLLKNSNLSVSEICFLSGFNNVSHFYTGFRKKFDLTPREFRKKS